MSEARFLYAEIEALPSAEKRVTRLIGDYADLVRAEPGNRRFDAFTLSERPERFFIFEEYESEEAFVAHKSAEYCGRFNECLAPLVVGGGSQLTWLDPIT